ncbi:MAG TPA: hypothetical protein VKN18_17115 [Blastocatellia bacterium]|nr:hypothetical protein [Blastocatellia bacterium]
MKDSEQPPSNNWLQRLEPVKSIFRAATSKLKSRSTQPTPEVEPELKPASNHALKIAGYSLVLMDPDGQVVWTREWDSGGVFEFRPNQRLWIFCGFTNHTKRETEISEYEVELMGEDGMVIERFGNSFGDSVIIPPGESKDFPAEWQM